MKKFKSINIVDIDGCICKNIFPMGFEGRISVAKFRARIKDSKIFSSFYLFYKKEIKSRFIFLTGRQEKWFKNETLNLLKPLTKNPEIIYFPDDIDLDFDSYILFKLENVFKIYNQFKKDKKIYYFDDNKLVINILNKLVEYNFLIKNIYFYYICSNDGWSKI